MIEAIAHPTDFSAGSGVAFVHALRLALEHRCRLDLLHVKSQTADDAWQSFPHVREVLTRWGVLPPGASPEEIEPCSGVKVRKIEIRHDDAARGVAEFLVGHRSDLLVLATHGSKGPLGWLSGSISEAITRKTHLPTLFVGEHTRPFVAADTGALSLDTILMPVAETPPPARALARLRDLLAPLAPDIRLMHAGDRAPMIVDGTGHVLKAEIVAGPVPAAIIGRADSLDADLIAMPTAGHQGFLDALRGSTTEQVLHRSHRPLLAVPA